MFSESKVTEIYCLADDFCKEFAVQQEKYMIEDKSRPHRNKPNPYERCGNYGYSHLISFGGLPLFQTLLFGICL